MGTVSSLSYAMAQSHLNPVQQLALIVVANSCGEWFIAEEAINAVVKHTSLGAASAESVVFKLIDLKHIDCLPHVNTGQYFITELHDTALDQSISKPVTIRDFSGYVYLIQSPQGAYKIGKTRNPESRFQTFGLTLPFEIEYVCVIKTNLMSNLEKELHERFAHKRLRGEWFQLEPNDVSYIMSLAANHE